MITLTQFRSVFSDAKAMKFVFEMGRLFQYLATLTGVFSILTLGINIGWTSPYLPLLLNTTISPVPITSTQASWCAIMPLIGAPFGAFVGALIVDKIGRKRTVLSAGPFVLMSYICVAYAENLFMILIPRFIIGSAEGLLYTSLPMYVAEIADPNIRGFLSSTITVAYMSGVLFINITGSLFSIFASSLISASICIMHMATFIWMPESPYYLIKKLNYHEALSSLEILRGRSDVHEEMYSLRAAIERQEKQKGASVSELISVKSNRKAVMIFVILSLTNNFSGKNPLIFFTTLIFQRAGIPNPDFWVVNYSLVGLTSMIAGLCIVDRVGRRPLFIFSASGAAVALAVAGTYFSLMEFAPAATASFTWVPVVALLSYNILFSVGLSFGAVLLLGELFPTNIKGKALGLGDTFTALTAALTSQYFHVINEVTGMYLSFWTFSFCCLVGTVFIYYFVIETRKKTLEEIQLELIGVK